MPLREHERLLDHPELLAGQQFQQDLNPRGRRSANSTDSRRMAKKPVIGSVHSRSRRGNIDLVTRVDPEETSRRMPPARPSALPSPQ